MTVTYDMSQSSSGFFRVIMLLYFVPFFVGIMTMIYLTLRNYTDINRAPLYFTLKQLVIIAFLNITTIITDYIAINST